MFDIVKVSNLLKNVEVRDDSFINIDEKKNLLKSKL
jgi:hypothetical protein